MAKTITNEIWRQAVSDALDTLPANDEPDPVAGLTITEWATEAKVARGTMRHRLEVAVQRGEWEQLTGRRRGNIVNLYRPKSPAPIPEAP